MAIYRSTNVGLQNYLDGCTIDNNGTFPTTAIDINPGVAADQGSAQLGLMKFPGLGQKRVNQAWSQGAATGGLDQGSSIAVNAAYHVYVIQLLSGVIDACISTAPSGPVSGVNIPTIVGYRRVGSFMTNGSAQITQFYQVNDTFWLNPGVNLTSGNVTTASNSIALGIPYGLTYTAIFIPTINTFNNNANNVVNFAAPGQPIATPAQYFMAATCSSMRLGYTNAGGLAGGASAQAGNPTTVVRIPTSTGNIVAQSSTNTTTLNLYVLGYIDARGRN